MQYKQQMKQSSDQELVRLKQSLPLYQQKEIEFENLEYKHEIEKENAERDLNRDKTKSGRLRPNDLQEHSRIYQELKRETIGRKQSDRIHIYKQNQKEYQTEVKSKIDCHANHFAEDAKNYAKQNKDEYDTKGKERARIHNKRQKYADAVRRDFVPIPSHDKRMELVNEILHPMNPMSKGGSHVSSEHM